MNKPIRTMSIFCMLLFGALLLNATYLQYVDAGSLNSRADNKRVRDAEFSRKRGAIVATTLRARPVAEKTAICRAVVEHVWPLVADGTIKAVIDTTMPLAEAAEGHRRMESSGHTGKIVLVA